MVDTSNFSLDTPVRIKIMESGIYIPELSTYTPLESFASIDEVIAILNRGVEVKFPDQENREITLFIEDLLLDYQEKKNELSKTYGDIGTNIDSALSTIQEINDSSVPVEEEIMEEESKIFYYDDIINRIVKDLRDGDDLADVRRLAAENNSGVDHIERERKLRKSRERNAIRKQEALELARLEAETFLKLTNDGKMTFDLPDDNDFQY